MRFKIKQRNKEPEWMDDPTIDPTILDTAVHDINKCNTWLGGYKFTTKAVKSLIEQHPQSSYHIIDVGCSDGAMLRHLSRNITDHELKLEGIDLSARSIAMATKKSTDYEDISFRNSDIFQTPLNDITCDIVLVTLTLHHFNEVEIPKFLERFQQMARVGIIINDLHRSPIAYTFFKVFSPIFIGNEISIHDGLISIASGFRRQDFKRYAREANIKDDLLAWKWSFRYIWTIPTYER